MAPGADVPATARYDGPYAGRSPLGKSGRRKRWPGAAGTARAVGRARCGSRAHGNATPPLGGFNRRCCSMDPLDGLFDGEPTNVSVVAREPNNVVVRLDGHELELTRAEARQL